MIFTLGWMHQNTLDFCTPETYNSQLSIFGFVDVRFLPGGENHGSFFPWTDLELEAMTKQVKATDIIQYQGFRGWGL